METAAQSSLKARRADALRRLQAGIEPMSEIAERARAPNSAAEVAAPKMETKIDVSANPIHKIMAEDDLSNEEKIDAIARYLTAEGDDFPKAREHFAAFEAYFSYLQSEGMFADAKGVRSLIEEVKSALKPEIAKIANNMTEVQLGIEDTKRMLEALRAARLEGKTLEQITDAIRENDRLLAEIADLQRAIGLNENEVQRREAQQKEAYDRKIASEQGFWNGMKRLLGGADKDIARTIEMINGRLNAAKEEVTRTKQQLTERETERKRNLEDGPLTLLRTLDLTEQSFSEKVVETAEADLSLITGAMESVDRLKKRTTFSEKAAREINQQIAAAQVREIVLKGALHRVAEATHEQGAGLKTQLDGIDQQLQGTQDGDAERATLSVQRIQVAQKEHGAQDYEEALNRTVMLFEVIAANSVDAQSQSNELGRLIQREKDVLNSLSSEALPATSRALRMTLTQTVVLQTGELASSVAAITNRARAISRATLGDLIDAQEDLHKQNIEQLDQTIEALGQAEEMMTTRLEKTVEEALQNRDRMGRVGVAANSLREILEDLNEIRPSVVARDQAEPTAPQASATAKKAGAAPTP
jgi:hypothetical protein